MDYTFVGYIWTLREAAVALCILAGAFCVLFAGIYFWSRWGDMDRESVARFVLDMRWMLPLAVVLFFAMLFFATVGFHYNKIIPSDDELKAQYLKKVDQ